MNLNLQQGSPDLWQGRLHLWYGNLDLQQVEKIFSGGRKNVRPFSCIIKCSKLASFSNDISLPQYGYPTQINRLWQGDLDLWQGGLDLWQGGLDL